MTIFTFSDALDELEDEFAFRIANEARPQSDYVLTDVLPENNRRTYNVESGSMTIRPTMAGLTAMDSPYAPSGHAEVSTFLEKTAKITNEVSFPEGALRELQREVRSLDITTSQAKEAVVQEVFNFTAAVLVQSHIDTAEYLRGQALMYGNIDWTFGDVNLNIDYGIPSEHVLNTRTISSGDAYSESGSTFWADHKQAVQALGFNYMGPYMHYNTFQAIIENEANDIQIVEENAPVFQIARFRRDENGNRTEMLSRDTRDRASVVVYSQEAEIIDPANPEQTQTVPFIEPGRIFYVGEGKTDDFRVGTGSTEAANLEFDLGYTHLGPTVEGNGQPGRWANVYTPQGQEWQLIGQGVQNMLPVIENEERLFIMSTEMP